MIFGIDPGVHTGFAWVNEQVEGYNPDSRALFVGRGWSGEWSIASRICDAILDLAPRVAGSRNVVCIEDFILYGNGVSSKNKARDGLSPVRVQSAILSLFCEREMLDKLELRVVSKTASWAKAGCPDWRLKRLGLWIGLSFHERDAFRHIVTYQRNVGIVRV